MIKTSQLDSATELTAEDLIMISQLINETDFKSFNTTLGMLKKLLGDITVVDVGVNLNTLTTPGIYILQGAATIGESYNLNYPSGLYPGGKVLMTVSAEMGDRSMIVQTYFYAKLTSNPCPYSRGKSGGSAWDAWTQPVSQTAFDQKAVSQVNKAQGNIELHTVGSNLISTIWSFTAPTESTDTPAIKTSPTLKPGVKLNLRIPNTPSVIGTYRGNTFIADQDGRLFSNVDTTQPTNLNNPTGVNWREYIQVPLDGLPAISYPVMGNMESTDAVLKQVIDLLRGLRIIRPGEAVVTAVEPDPGTEPTDVFPGTAFTRQMRVTPHNTKAPIYVRSSNPAVLKVPAVNAWLYIESIISVHDSATDTSTLYGAVDLYAEGVAAGKATLEMSATSDFATVLYREEVEVKAN